MRKKTLFRLFLIFAIGLSPVLGYSVFAQDSEKFIQGTWRLEGELPKNESGRTFSWFLEWTFSNGAFVQTGYPPLRQEGKYRIVKKESSKLTLELYEQTGNFGTENKQIEIVIDKKKKKLKIDGKTGFTRVKK
jgi:hypothetical protein